MRIDQVRISEMLKAYEKSLGSSRKQGGDRDRLPAMRDEVIISTEAKRLMIRDQVVSQVVDRLRNPPLPASSLQGQASHNLHPVLDAILEEVADDGRTPLDLEEKARIRDRSLKDFHSKRASE